MSPHSPSNIQAFKLDRSGLARVFGELEAAVMEVLWRSERATVNEVIDALGPDFNYKTVMTVMNRLVEKKVLRRRRVARAYVYSPAESREDFTSRLSRSVAEGLLADFGDLALAQFVDAMDAVDPELIERLERLLEEKSVRSANGSAEETEV